MIDNVSCLGGFPFFPFPSGDIIVFACANFCSKDVSFLAYLQMLDRVHQLRLKEMNKLIATPKSI